MQEFIFKRHFKGFAELPTYFYLPYSECLVCIWSRKNHADVFVVKI